MGAAIPLNSSPMILNAARTLGAGYLVWLGYGLIRGGMKRWNRDSRAVDVLEDSSYLDSLHPVLAALTLSLTNPKTIFSFVSFFALFIQPGYAYPVHTFLYLAIVLQLVSMTYLKGLIFTG